MSNSLNLTQKMNLFTMMEIQEAEVIFKKMQCDLDLDLRGIKRLDCRKLFPTREVNTNRDVDLIQG